MNINTLLYFYIIRACTCYTSAHDPHQAIVNLNAVARQRKFLKSARVLLSARDWNGTATASVDTFFIKHANILFSCTATDASMCPRLHGKEWKKKDNRLIMPVKTRGSGAKLTMTVGSTEYSCFTIFPQLCPAVAGGVWVPAGINNGRAPAETKPRENRDRSATVSCFARNVQICKKLMTDDSWVIKNQRNIGEAPGTWMITVNGAELFCNSQDVINCPFNDREWIVVPLNTKQMKIRRDEKNPETEELTIIDNFRRQKNMHDDKVKYNRKYDGKESCEQNESERDENKDGKKCKKEDGEKEQKENETEDKMEDEQKDEKILDKIKSGDLKVHNNREDGGGGSHGSNERESFEKESGEHSGNRDDTRSHEKRSSDSGSADSTEEGSGVNIVKDAVPGPMVLRRVYGSNTWKGVVQSKEPSTDLDISEEHQSSEDLSSYDDVTIPTNDSRDSSLKGHDSSADYSEERLQYFKSWSTRIGTTELICRAPHKRSCPRFRNGRKGAIKWHRVDYVCSVET